MRIAIAFAAAWLTCSAFANPAAAQDKDFNLSVHATSDKTTAADIGLPAYPGAKTYKPKDDSSNSADLAFALGSFRIALRVAQYESTDAPEKVTAFYRKALSKYGQVLECDHGQPVGALKQTNTGLTCSDNEKHQASMNFDGHGSGDKGHELRAGKPGQYRMFAVDDDSTPHNTKFALLYLELPKDSN